MPKPNKFLVFLSSFLIITLSIPLEVFCLPQPKEVVAGSADFKVSGNSMQVKTSDKVIINYDSFSIGEPESVNFLQPSATSCALNRVVSSIPSDILGSLSANGRIFLVNPNGIFFGPNSRIDTGSFIASTLDIANEDFLAENYNFFLKDAMLSSIVNQGEIRVADGEFVALIAPRISNEGLIQVNLGKVALASGEDVSLDFTGDGLINFAVEGSVEDALVTNKGEISADGGEVLIAVDAAKEVIEEVINNEGIIQAKSLVNDGGSIRLVGGQQGQIVNRGTIDASAKEDGANGGEINVDGSQVGQFGQVHADATRGDGGEIDIYAEDIVVLSPDSLTSANAGANGDGGEVIVFSPDTALFHKDAKIEAKGGELSGDGGFIEVSGKEHVEINGSADAGAVNGNPGEFLIDPYNVEITNANANGGFAGGLWTPAGTPSTVNEQSIEDLLDDGTNVTISTTDGGLEDGNITVSSTIDKDSCDGTTLTLDADNNIVLGVAIFEDSFPFGIDAVNLVLDATAAVDINAAVDTGGGTFTSNGTNFDNSDGGTIMVDGAAVTINNTGAVIVGSAINTGTNLIGGAISFTNPTSLTLAADLTTRGGDVTVGGAGDIIIDTSITVETAPAAGIVNAGSIDLGSSNIYANAPGYDLVLSAGHPSYAQNGGNVTIGVVDNNAGGASFLNDLSIDADGGTTDGTVTLNGNISVDDDGAGDISSVNIDCNVVLSDSVTIDTENAGDASGGSVDLSASTVSADANGYDLSIDTSTSDEFMVGGNVILGEFSNGGGFYVNDLSVTTTAGPGYTPGSLALRDNISLDTNAADTADFLVEGEGDVIIDADVTIDTEQGDDADGGWVAFSMGESKIYSNDPTYDFAIDASTDGAGCSGGGIVLGEIGNNSGGAEYVNSILLDSTGGVGGMDAPMNLFGDMGTADSPGNNIVISGMVEFLEDTTLTTDRTTNDGDLTFNGSLDGEVNFTLNIGGTTTFNGTVGANTALGEVGVGVALTINSTGPTSFESTLEIGGGEQGIVQADTAGPVTFKDDVAIFPLGTGTVFNADVVFDGLEFVMGAEPLTIGNEATDQLTLSGGPVTITTLNTFTVNSLVDGAQNLILQIDTDNPSAFNAPVGSVTPIGSGTDPALVVEIGSDQIVFASTLETASGINQVDFGADLVFQDDVTVAAGDTDSTFSDNVTFDGLTFTAAAGVTFGNDPGDAFTLSGGPTVVTTAAAGEYQTWTGTVDSAIGDTQGLTIQTGTGALTFTDLALVIGGDFALDHLVTNSDSVVQAGGIGIFTEGANGISMTVTGAGNAIDFDDGFLMSTGGPLTLQADDLILTSMAVEAAGQDVTLRPNANGREIDLGTNTAGKLGITDAELDMINADKIIIGSATSGPVTLTSDIDTANTDSMQIISGSTVDTSSNTLTEATIDIDATDDATLGVLTATGAVTVESSDGSILDGIGDTNNITAGADSTLWAKEIVGTEPEPLDVNVNGGSLSVYAEGVEDDVSVHIDGTVLPSNTLAMLNSPPGSVIFNGTVLNPGPPPPPPPPPPPTGGAPPTVQGQLNPTTGNQMPPLWLFSQTVNDGTVTPGDSPLEED
ncbi:MAG: filamentous hemagglutinin N-terminal domain-containing protein [Candidatus Omnitrophica bacterium]|nr:filamentous hemagglutinin N-terminal domain-containing protein [Candidatus Omnitrophota bacterium]